MTAKHKKIVTNEQREPMESMIPWADLHEISELLGIDPDEADRPERGVATADGVAGNRGN